MTIASAALLTAVPSAYASAAHPSAAQAGTGTDSDSALDRYYRQRPDWGGCATGPGDTAGRDLDRAGGGEVATDPDVVHRMLRRRRTVDPLEALSDGERGVLALMAEGLSNSAIARRLHCRTHLPAQC
ncbi:hypothetical protein ADK86_35255 [Streptomyces sp. NRRL F-5755]|nr:hypothetical protein ADK86_35255 [Streptomyces sp. NRRL F-5755]